MDLVNVFNGYIAQSLLIVPLIVGIVEAIKLTALPNKYAPLVSLAVGIGMAFLTRSMDAYWTSTVLAGIVYGLSAAGLYSSAATLMRDR